MANRYTHYDRYCKKCGKRIEDGEDYYKCSFGVVTCIKCSDEMCVDCDGCKEYINGGK